MSSTRKPTVTLEFSIQTTMLEGYIGQIGPDAYMKYIKFDNSNTNEEFPTLLGKELQHDVYPMSFKFNSGDIIFYDKNGKILTYIENHE